ncbi:sensor histidine kinase [Novosphingobium taihuense]|uniref:Signal transduction histidine kinase n=1 Tax=Novosphingobium taihuense TaxID=260085 RepID=A0A7W7EUQ7_9SPHN|nr:signal transduction histidine kinase [Novosphingobium taihuense]TWH86085.1 histidine kinase [Novosphingobium taihuense]
MTSSQIDPGIPRVPARQVILSAAALWLCYFLLITVRGLVVELGDFSDLLWRRALVTAAGIVVTVACWPLLRRFDARPLATRVAAALVIMLPAALALAAVNQWAFAPVEKRMIERISNDQSGQTSTTTQTTVTNGTGKGGGVKIRHDMAGNVLVDVLDEGFIPPEPPEPPAPKPAPSPNPAPSARPTPTPEPLLDEEDIAELRKLGDERTIAALKDAGIIQNPDGSTVITQPGLYVKQYADGRSEVRTGGKVYTVDEDGEVAGVEEAPAPPALPATAALPAPPAPPAPVLSAAMQERIRQTAQREAEKAMAKAEALREIAQERDRAARTRQAKNARLAEETRQPPAKAAPATAPKVPVADSPQPSPSDIVSEEYRGPDHVTIIRQTVENEGLWRQLTDVALGRYFLLIAWAALYLALGNGEQLRAAEYREGQYARAAKAAELRSLRYQVNPHFLFNTLNSLSALVMVGRTEQAERMIQSISRFYRHSLAGDPTTDMPLEDEIALQRHYLDIEAVRFPERLRCEFDIPEELMSACVPGMILQPLVENSIKYAVSTTIRPVTIRITAREAGGFLVLTVADDGPGEGFANGGTGIGIANVKSRLAARFGEDAGKVESGPLPAGGYATVLTMPVVRNEC